MLSQTSALKPAPLGACQLPTSSGLTPTPEQLAILRAASRPESLYIEAMAGTGKTSTMVMLAQALAPAPYLALAFNVKNKKDLSDRLPDFFEVKTFNGLGHSAWAKACGKRLTLDDKKLGKIITELLPASLKKKEDAWRQAKDLCSKAMQMGLVPEGVGGKKSLVPDTTEHWQEVAQQTFGFGVDLEILDLARTALIKNIALAKSGLISFDDQIYMSAMFGGVFPRFPIVIVDEAQDLSPLNHIQVSRVASDRLFVVGDPRQAIYQFRGADGASMQNMRKLRDKWIDLRLSLTFRCPKVIVERQQIHAPGYSAAPSNKLGQVLELPVQSPGHTIADAPVTWKWSDIPAEQAFVLCRNNAPLVSLAFKLIRQNRSVVMLGRDIGKNLTVLSKKIIPDDKTPAKECRELVVAWRQRESESALRADKEEKLAGIEDRAECLLAVLDSGEPIADAQAFRTKLKDLFGRETGKITLSTIHRAKGLESQVVVHLDPWRLPSKQALRAKDQGNFIPMEQELNLLYVCETRAQETLILANLRDFE